MGVTQNYNFVFGSIPNNIMKLNNGSEYGGWSSTSPYLYAVGTFSIPIKGPCPKSLHQRMNILLKVNGWTRRVLLAVRNSLIFVAREPRFYAWLEDSIKAIILLV